MPTVAAYIVLQDPPTRIGDIGSDDHIQFEVPDDLDVDTRIPNAGLSRGPSRRGHAACAPQPGSDPDADLRHRTPAVVA